MAANPDQTRQQRAPMSTTKLLDEESMTTFLERLPDVVPFLDQDSTRFNDWFSAYRLRDGRDTFSDYFTLPEEYVKVPTLAIDTKTLSEEIPRETFDNIYLSKDTFRGFRFDGDIPDLYVLLGISGGGRLVVSVSGGKDEVESIINRFKEKYVIPESLKIHQLNNITDNGPDIQTTMVPKKDFTLGNDTFYPWLEGGIEKFAHDFYESRSNLVFLYGEWGTGKTTFLRTLFFLMGYSEVSAVSSAVVFKHPAFGKWIAEHKEGSFIYAEDADQLVTERSEGNFQMNLLLNKIEGVVPTRTKLAISTNLCSTSNVDPALIRPGRAFDILQFRRLTVEEANIARDSVGLGHVNEFKAADTGLVITELTLAEALCYDNVRSLGSHRRATMGF